MPIVLALLVLSRPASAGQTRYFPHDDERYLSPRQKNGGTAFIPSGVTRNRPVPAIVFLHGTNASRQPHLWFGARGRDLRPLVEALVAKGKVGPFVLAGPSQTKSAVFGRTLWQKFSLTRFTADLQLALAGRAIIDESRLILIGHSGAGCNPSGGLAGDYRGDGTLSPMALVAIDPCLNEEMGSAFALQSPQIPLWMFWQTRAWSRDIEGWLGALAERPVAPAIAELDAPLPNPHRSIVPMALELVARELVGPPSGREGDAAQRPQEPAEPGPISSSGRQTKPPPGESPTADCRTTPIQTRIDESLSTPLEQYELSRLASQLAQRSASMPADYVRGETWMRDLLVDSLRCSMVDAESLVDLLDARGFAWFTADRSKPQRPAGWSFDTAPMGAR